MNVTRWELYPLCIRVFGAACLHLLVGSDLECSRSLPKETSEQCSHKSVRELAGNPS